MLKYINDFLNSFKGVFNRPSTTYNNFLIMITGLIARQDMDGITSIVRSFDCGDSLYRRLLGFCHSKGFETAELLNQWQKSVADNLNTKKIGGRNVLVADGLKNPKAGRFIPSLKSMRQSSADSNKKELFLGHLFGSVGVLGNYNGDMSCVPLSISIQEGNRTIDSWRDKEHHNHIQQVLMEAFNAINYFGKSYQVLDRYFLSKSLLSIWKDHDNRDNLDIIARCKKNVVGYEFPQPVPAGKRGPRPKHGKKVKIFDFFEQKDTFTTTSLSIYGKETEISYRYVDLLWGEKFYQPLRFVLVETDGHQSVFATTDLSADPLDIIEAYSYRFRIEQMFKDLIHLFGGLNYRFWSNAVPKASLHQNMEEVYSEITDHKEQERIINAFRAVHNFVACAIIAMGCTQLLCQQFGSNVDPKERRYQRTYKGNSLSLGEMKELFSRKLLWFCEQDPELPITRLIKKVHSHSLLKAA